MRSEVPRTGPAGPPDTTARARIRDAAILRFGRDGFGVGVRAIALDAGVSAALVLHHFGSKDGLREACDEQVLRLVREQKEAAVGHMDPSQVMAILASMDESAPLLAYALKSMQAGGDLARSFIDHFAADTEYLLRAGVAAGTIVPSIDETARARYVTVQAFGTLLLDLALNPPEDPTDLVAVLRGSTERLGVPTTELYTQGLLTDRTVLDAMLEFSGDPSPPGAGPAPANPSPESPLKRESAVP